MKKHHYKLVCIFFLQIPLICLAFYFCLPMSEYFAYSSLRAGQFHFQVGGQGAGGGE